ncbi:MAG: MGDG synthase family glycosyltransferase [Christensenellales bacterium]
MKVLILSCNTGQGHNSAGRALFECFTHSGIPCEMKDALSFAGEKASRLVSSGYINMATHAPNLFRCLYAAGGLVSTSRSKSPVYWANVSYTDALHRYILDKGFDTIITPHLFPAEALTHLLRKHGLAARCYAVATDYTCIPFWEETELHGYFIPHRDLIPEFVEKGLPRERLFPLGIPVSSRFAQHTSQKQARHSLGLPEEGKLFLMMSGSMGFGNLEDLLARLLRLCLRGEHILVLGGTNERMKQRLRTRYGGHPQVSILDFTTQVPLYMDACDLVFTKPGGLTSTEAAVKNLPLVHTAPIPGCETKNARFFQQHLLSISEKNPDTLLNQAYALAYDEAAQRTMLAAQRKHIPRNAAEQIYRHIVSETMLKERAV